MEVVILGSGMGGAVLALELLRHTNFKVKLLDVDSLRNPFMEDMDLSKFTDPGLHDQRTVGYGYGGTSNLWHGVMGLLDEEDWAKACRTTQTALSNSVLREGLKDVARYHGSKVLLLDECNKVPEHQLSDWLNPEFFITKPYVVKLAPTRLRTAIRTAKDRFPDRLRLVENSVAVSLEHDECGMVTSVLVSSDASDKRVTGDLFVLALGGLETPRLLKQSFPGAGKTIDAAGACLLDHPHAVIGRLKLPSRVFFRQHAVNSFFFSNPTRVGLRVAPLFRGDAGKNHSIIIRPAFGDDESEARDLLKKVITSRKFISLFKLAVTRLSALKAIFILGCEKLGIGVLTREFLVTAQLEQIPEESGKVTISTACDSFGRCIPSIERNLHEKMLEDIRDIQRLCDQSCMNGAIFEPFEVTLEALLGGSHYAGTARLGLNSEKSVVDDDLKVHGFDNLFVCDASVLPVIGNVNLSLTISLLAVRLAKYLSDFKGAK